MFFRLCPMDLSSPTRDQTLIPCSGSTESKPLDHQGRPVLFLFFNYDKKKKKKALEQNHKEILEDFFLACSEGFVCYFR